MTNRLLGGRIPIYGLLIASAIALSIFLCSREEKRLGLPKDFSLDLALWAIPAGIIGARLYYVAFRWDLYAENPLRILYLWEGGLAIYGGVIGGALGALLLCRRRRVSFKTVADLVAPVLILSQAIGRWGNFFNGEAYGYLVENPSWQFFPVAVQVNGAWHLATFFYESLWDFAGFWLLWLQRRRARPAGELFLKYLCWYGLGRALIEGLRTDSLMWGPVRVSQALSILLVLGAGTALLLRRRSARREGK